MAVQNHTYYVYIMTNASHSVLYIGVTNDLARRAHEHKTHAFPGFTARYHVDRLIYRETTNSITDAIAREKQLKHWSRTKKAALIAQQNPYWEELAVY